MKIAAAQIDIKFNEHQKNLDRALEIMSTVSEKDVRLIVFPECSLCGYCCDNKNEAREVAVTLESPYFSQLKAHCKSLNMFAVIGFLELDGDDIFNSLVCIGPDGIVATYRKTHLPMLGVDRFTTPGEQYGLFEIDGVNIGMLICYDCSFPEATRVLALKGADMVLLPTNWPSGAIVTSQVIPPARAMENNIYFVTVDRIGTERGFEFVGRSRISHPNGTNLAFADHVNEEILIAEIDPTIARQKHIVRVPNQHEINLIKDRRPDLYGTLLDPSE